MLPVCTWTSVTASAIGRMLVAASRLDEELMPSSDRLFWISRWPAPRKLRPMSLLSPPSTPGVVLARLQTLRPLDGRSTTARCLDGLRHGRAVGLNRGVRGLDGHRLGEVADGEHGVLADHLVAADDDAGRLVRSGSPAG